MRKGGAKRGMRKIGVKNRRVWREHKTEKWYVVTQSLRLLLTQNPPPFTQGRQTRGRKVGVEIVGDGFPVPKKLVLTHADDHWSPLQVE